MKKLRRLCMFPADTEPRMHTIYEYNGKLGTTASTLFWFNKIPKLNEDIWGICLDTDRVSPYMDGHAFRYAEFSHFLIDKIYFEAEYGKDFIFCKKL